jgi:hypothetical protein
MNSYDNPDGAGTPPGDDHGRMVIMGESENRPSLPESEGQGFRDFSR